MTYKENITAILECYFSGFKKEIIDSACNRILEQEPKAEKIIKMRDATSEEQKSVDDYIKSISKPTGVNFGALEQQPCEDAICDRENSEIKNEVKDLSKRVETLEKQMEEDKEEQLKKLKAELDYAKFRCAL